MTEYNLILLLHLLLFVYWLGADIGVYYGSRYVADASLSRETRATALKIMLWIDQIPRVCLVLILPVGYTLGFQLGLVETSSIAIGAVWILAVAWLSLVLAIHHLQGTGLGEALRKTDMIVRVVIILGLTFDAWRSIAGHGHIQAPWMAVKMQIFALLIFFGLMIRVVSQRFVVAFGRLMREGSSAEIEADISSGLARAKPWVLAIWIGLIAAAFIGLQKPSF